MEEKMPIYQHITLKEQKYWLIEKFFYQEKYFIITCEGDIGQFSEIAINGYESEKTAERSYKLRINAKEKKSFKLILEKKIKKTALESNTALEGPLLDIYMEIERKIIEYNKKHYYINEDIIKEKLAIELQAKKEAWLVYSDWLQTKGDNRGELINLEYLEETSSKINEKRKKLRCYENYLTWSGVALASLFQLQHIFLNKEEYIKPFIEEIITTTGNKNKFGLFEPQIQIEWKFGFIYSVSINIYLFFNNINYTNLYLQAILASPSTMFLSHLSICFSNGCFADIFPILRQNMPHQGVRKFKFSYHDFNSINTIQKNLVTQGDLAEVFPKLQTLSIQAHGDSLCFDQLTHSTVQEVELDAEIEVIDKINFPNAVTLKVTQKSFDLLEKYYQSFNNIKNIIFKDIQSQHHLIQCLKALQPLKNIKTLKLFPSFSFKNNDFIEKYQITLASITTLEIKGEISECYKILFSNSLFPNLTTLRIIEITKAKDYEYYMKQMIHLETLENIYIDFADKNFVKAFKQYQHQFSNLKNSNILDKK